MIYILVSGIFCSLAITVQGQADPNLIPWINYDFNYCFVNQTPCKPADISPISVVLYKGGRQASFTLDKQGADAILANPDFDKSLTSVFFMYGYTANDKTESSQQMRDAYATIEPVTNFFIFNVSVIFGGTFLDPINYIRVSQATVCIGKIVASFLVELINNGASSVNKLHLIGHSMGAQTLSSTGKNFYSMTGMNLSRISGMDPAGPCFSNTDGNQLNKQDATLVDIIHTNAGIMGTPNLLGSANFIPNGGITMPGCTGNVSCSHNFASHLWRESVTGNSCIYTSTSSHLLFYIKYIFKTNTQIQPFGYKYDGKSGLFDAITNSSYQYCKGPSGINSS